MINFAWKFSKINEKMQKNNRNEMNHWNWKKFSKMLMRKKSKFSNGTELTNIDEIHMRIFDNFEQLLFCLDKAIF